MARRSSGQSGNREEKEFDQRVVEVARVTRVTAGGKRMRFRALVVIGDHKGRVGAGLAKGADVSMAISKATAQARKSLNHVPMLKETIPHEVWAKEGAAQVLIKPAPLGTGIIAGGVVRIVMELAGVGNAVSKILGSSNKVNTVRATMKALNQLQLSSPVRRQRSAERKHATEANRPPSATAVVNEDPAVAVSA